MNANNYHYAPNVDARGSDYLPQVVDLLSVIWVVLRRKYNGERTKNISGAALKMR